MSSAASSGAAAGAVASASAVANAIKASGTLVRVEPGEFARILKLQLRPLVVRAEGGLFTKSYKYLTSYSGLAFYCKSAAELRLPQSAELIEAAKIHIPEL